MSFGVPNSTMSSLSTSCTASSYGRCFIFLSASSEDFSKLLLVPYHYHLYYLFASASFWINFFFRVTGGGFNTDHFVLWDIAFLSILTPFFISLYIIMHSFLVLGNMEKCILISRLETIVLPYDEPLSYKNHPSMKDPRC